MELIETFGKKYPEKNVKLIEKYKEEIKVIEEAQMSVDGVVGALVEEFCKIEAKPQEIV
jgi:hypothetical protein